MKPNVSKSKPNVSLAKCFGELVAFLQIQIAAVFSIKGEKKGKGERGKEKFVSLSILGVQCFPNIFIAPSCARRAAPPSAGCRGREATLPRARESGSSDLNVRKRRTVSA